MEGIALVDSVKRVQRRFEAASTCERRWPRRRRTRLMSGVARFFLPGKQCLCLNANRPFGVGVTRCASVWPFGLPTVVTLSWYCSVGRVCKERKSLSCECNALLSAGNGKSSVVVAAVGRLVDSYLVDPASSHMLVSKTKPCMSKYKRFYTVKLRMAH